VAVVIVDAENVRRSCWPNLSRDDLVARAHAWAEHEGHELRIVFEEPYADDEIVRLTETLSGPVWVVTSDRGLRARLTGVERVLGGGAFVRVLEGYG
jgi:hypothetical protein